MDGWLTQMEGSNRCWNLMIDDIGLFYLKIVYKLKAQMMYIRESQNYDQGLLFTCKWMKIKNWK